MKETQKEETGKFMKNGLYILWYAKKALLGMKHSQTMEKSSPLP